MLRGDIQEAGAVPYLWITTAAQMGMGFVLPFALTFVAIPLETFIHSLRTVLGMLAVALLRFAATALRVLATVFRGLGRFSAQMYDVLAALPLWVSHRLRDMATRRDQDSAKLGGVSAPEGFQRL